MIQEPILIVDDELTVRSTLQEALNNHGYTADAVASGEQALEYLADRSYSVVLTDLNLPGGISGLELMAAIRQRQPETLCILVTAFATLDISIEALKRGAYDLIQKPFRLSEIEAVLNRALDYARLVRQVGTYREELESRILSRSRDLQEAHREAVALCDLSLQGLDAASLDAALAPLLDRLVTRWAPDGVGCYRQDQNAQSCLVARRGLRNLPALLDRPQPGPLASPGLGYPEERLVPLGNTGWLYLGFEDRSAFSDADLGFLLLARHLELILRLR
jgi:DNA-binding response OmpR family regulator